MESPTPSQAHNPKVLKCHFKIPNIIWRKLVQPFNSLYYNYPVFLLDRLEPKGVNQKMHYS